MHKNPWYRLFATCVIGGSLVAGCADFGGEELTAEIGTTQAPLLGADDKDAIPGKYIVVFKDEVSALDMSRAMTEVSARSATNVIERTYAVIPGFNATLDRATVAELRRNPNVSYIEQDRVVRLSAVQNNPRPGLDRIDERQLPRDGQYNDRGFNGTGVHMYIIDTGIRTTHNEFSGRVGAGATAINDGFGANDCNGHGTHVASSAAGSQFGVAKNAILHAIRVLDCNGGGSLGGVIAGVDFVRTNGERPAVANLSLGGGASTAMDNAVNNLSNAGVPVVVAAGNENQNACNVSPARASQVITVAAVDDNDRKPNFSNFGGCVEIFAPGVAVLGADIGNNNDTQTISGTSMASPHVAGVAAMILDQNPNRSASQVRNIIINNATTGVVSNTRGSPNRLLFNDF